MIQFSEENHTFVVGHEFSFLAILTGIVGDVYDVAQLSSTATSSSLSDKQKYPYFSRLSPPSFGQVSLIIDTLLYFTNIRGRGWDSIGLISTTDEYGVDSAETLIENVGNEISILTYQQYIPESTEFTVELNEIQKSGARVIVALVLDSYEGLIVEANDFGLVGENYVWFVPDAVVGTMFETEEASLLSNGVLGSFQYLPDPGESEKYDKFLERWMNLDPNIYPGAGEGKTIGPYALLGYETIITAARAIEIVYTLFDNNNEIITDSTRISADIWQTAVRMVKYNGVSGDVSFDDHGDRISDYSLLYYNYSLKEWIKAGIWSETSGIQIENEIIWYSNTTEIPDLDIREPFHYWSCSDKKLKYDPTGKTIEVETPDGNDVDDIDSEYHCDQFIDCKNISDESSDCSQNFIILYIVIGVITGCLILIALLLLIFVVIFGLFLKYRRLRASSPVFTIIILISIIIGFSSIYSWFGKPHPVSCGFRPWLLGLPVISMISALCAKSYRIWKIFRDMKRHSITDFQLLIIWIVMMIPVLLILVIWTIVSTPTAKMKDIDGTDHYVCTTGGFTGEPGGYVFFAILVFYGAIVLLLGVFLSIVTRKVPALFNESKLLAISIYNLGFLAVVIIPVFLVVDPYNPFLAWILRSIAILYAFSATMFLQFTVPVFSIIFIDKLQNATISGKNLTGYSSEAS